MAALFCILVKNVCTRIRYTYVDDAKERAYDFAYFRTGPLQQVRLLPGEHSDAQQAGARYLLELDVDRLLYPFRREAGLPQPTDADGTLHWRRALAGGEFQYAMRGRGQAHRLEIEVIADSAESDGENTAYEVMLDGLPLQRGEHRRIDGDPTAIDVYPLPDAIEAAETAENIENTGENDNADDAAIVRISASAHDGAKITALRLHK